MSKVEIIRLNSARNALRYLLKAYKIPKICVPYYICPAIKSTLNKEFCKVEYYHIDDKFMPVGKFKWDDFILYPNYFGICTNNVKVLSKKYFNLIVDNAHAYYSEPMGLASFNSPRKFFQKHYGIMEGAYLYTKKVLDKQLRISEDYEIDEEINYEKFLKNENRLDKEPLMLMSHTTEKIMSYINYEEEKEWRLNNFYMYAEKFGKTNELKFELEKDEIPFVYPYFTHNEKIGYELANQGLEIYRYWEGIPSIFDEYKFYKYLIPIPLF